MEKRMHLLRNRKIQFVLIVTLAAFIFMVSTALANTAYEVKIDGKPIAVVKDQEDVEAALEDIKEEMENILKKEVILNHEIIIEKAEDTQTVRVQDIEQLKELIQAEIDISTQAYAIEVNGKVIAYLKSKQEAEELLNTIQEMYTKVGQEEEELKEAGFVEEVNVIQEPAPLGQIQDGEKALEFILFGREEAKRYTVKDGDTVWDIMSEYDLTLEEMEDANPDADLDRIQIGQDLIVVAPKPLINVKTVESTIYEEEIAFEVEYQSSDQIYEGQSQVKVKGHEGKKRVRAELININGVQREKKIIKEEILKEPVKEIIVRGTKERPKTMATGSFMTPARGRFSSGFGSRWGRSHNGIDIAMPTGTPVKAADGGRVTYSGTKGSYGKLVIINHENGLETRYAHNSSLLVKTGDRVYKGQTIAKSGNTGRSTGPHLHFEVRKNGTPVNPRKYIN